MRYYRNGSHAHAAVRRIDRPAPTVMFGARSNKVDWIEDDVADALRVTAQEAAVLQSYPADMEFGGTRTKQFLQIGNAVPPRVARHVLERLWNEAS